MKLIDYVKPQGAQTALAKLLQVPAVLVNQWANGRRQVPLDRCVEIEKATAGQVTCEELRPDKAEYWAYLRSATPRNEIQLAAQERVIVERSGEERRQDERRAEEDRRKVEERRLTESQSKHESAQ